MPLINEQICTTRNIELARHIILNADTFAICGHINPDGDSIGSMLSLGIGLENIGKQVYMLCNDDLPRNYQSLPGASKLIKTLHRQVDVAISVDCGSKEMTGKNVEVFERARWVIEIDHHRSRTPFGDVLLVDADAACAGELVYELLLELDVPITSDIAQNILTSLLVETNSFRLPGIRPQTFELCSELLKSGVDFYKLAESVYWVTSKESALLTGISLSRCCFSSSGEIAWSVLSRADFKKAGASDSDADSVSEKIRSIQGVKIAILFREKNSREWRVSLRSKDGINLTLLAEQFGGGGHLSAAGCTIPKKQKILCLLLKSAEELLKRHNSFKAQAPLTQTNLFSPAIPDEYSKLPEELFSPAINSHDNRLQNWIENKCTTPHFRKSVQSKLAS